MACLLYNFFYVLKSSFFKLSPSCLITIIITQITEKVKNFLEIMF